jgi:chorismate synthase
MQLLRYLTAGESHGPGLTVIVEGLPAGLPVEADYINHQLARRQAGYGRGGRMKIEYDTVKLFSGMRGGMTLGSPVSIIIENKDWVNWSDIMSAAAETIVHGREVTRPRPGHADLAGALKYRHADIRNVLERSSARETAARVAACSLARRLLEELGIVIIGQVIQIGNLQAKPKDITLHELQDRLAHSKLLCADSEVEPLMIDLIDRAREQGDTLGGIFEIRAYGLPAGLGSYVHWDRKLDGRLAAALMSIQAVKGVEIGEGFAGAARPGSQVLDEIFYQKDKGFYRTTNYAGGLEGGVTNGEPLVVRAAMKPIPTLNQPLQSIDIITREPAPAAIERSDICAVPAACVTGEAVLAWELAQACVEKFGGDSLAELKDNWQRHMAYLKQV